ncbi:WD40-repeat-containing domain protein [Endogone sp. FLAS-F59071]|nr:WD40-repeat-containing domain protein [Endogone sp. FLAS-F59071]|eukprot:RUS19682.1 WD40-repeat-containing domain protein [Endogone sp. FLAS-F59071]
MQLPELERKSIPFSPPLFSSLKISQVFRHSTKLVTSLSFDNTGELCITSSEDESLHSKLWLRNTLFSKKYGVDLLRFTHRQNNVINASTKEDDTIRYLSLHDNKYIRYFKGHCNRVVALEFSPVDDGFLSAAIDDTVRLWDLRSSACQGLIKIRGRPTVAFNETGVVFALGLESNTLKLYDLKALEKVCTSKPIQLIINCAIVSKLASSIQTTF